MKKSDMAASLDRADRRCSAVEPVSEDVVPAPSARPSSRKIRMTVDLVPEEFRDFKAWRDDQAERLDWARVTGQDVFRVLLRRLLADEALQAAVIEQLRNEA